MPQKQKNTKPKPRKIILLARSLTSLSAILLFAAIFGFLTNYYWTNTLQNSQSAKASFQSGCFVAINSDLKKVINKNTGSIFNWNNDGSLDFEKTLNLEKDDQVADFSDNIIITKKGLIIAVENSDYKILTTLNDGELVSISNQNPGSDSTNSKYYLLLKSGKVLSLLISSDFYSINVSNYSQSILANNKEAKFIEATNNQVSIWANDGLNYNLDGTLINTKLTIPQNSLKINSKPLSKGYNKALITDNGDIYDLASSTDNSGGYKLVNKLTDTVCNPK